VAAKKTKRATKAGKTFALYWVTTSDGKEDCFVVASSVSQACRFLEDIEGYERGDAAAEHVVRLPTELQDGVGWRTHAEEQFTPDPYYAMPELIRACGGEVGRQRSDAEREVLGVDTQDVRFGDRVFRPGDIIANVKREQREAEPARVSVFDGGRAALPEWWDWELELTPHVELRMEDREFTEVDLRDMLQRASTHRIDVVEGRFVIESRFRDAPWEVVIEPDQEDHLLVVVTAFRADR
jgi:hypothetical protein